jgi:hypothetical protein
MGFSQIGFYRFKEQNETGGEIVLREISRKKPTCQQRRRFGK